jgi:ABC-type nitrate/sulfonate/bicarbonate transport system ATPase subunit
VLLADRVFVLKEGRISLDLPIGLPRPRRVGGREFDALRDRFMRELGVLDPGREVPVAPPSVNGSTRYASPV